MAKNQTKQAVADSYKDAEKNASFSWPLKINATLDLQNLLPLVVQKASEAFNTSASSLALWDEAEEVLVIKASEGLSTNYVQEQCITSVSMPIV